MGQHRHKVEGAESLESSSLILLVEKPGPDVESAESLESSSLSLFVEETRPGVVEEKAPDLGGAEGGASSGRKDAGTSRGATPKGNEQGCPGG